MIKNILKIFVLLLLVGGSYFVWQSNFNYNFVEITKGKVFKSGFIKNYDTMESKLIDNKIKTVINLMNPSVQDKLNPAFQDDIDIEDGYIKKINKDNNLNIKHISLPSLQVPTKKTLTKFFEILDNKDNYPVLIHCYHGTGRAQMYSAIYRIEYEQWKNEDARSKTRILIQGLGYKSSFADGKSKGDFLIKYKPRNTGENSTLNKLEK